MTRNRIPAHPEDIAARRAAFQRLRRGIPHVDIARATGLSLNTVRSYSAPGAPDVAATWQAIEALRQEAIKRARKAVEIAESELFRTEIELQRLERMELPSSVVEGKSFADTAAVVADSKGNFPQPSASSRTAYGLQNSPLQSPPPAAVAGQI